MCVCVCFNGTWNISYFHSSVAHVKFIYVLNTLQILGNLLFVLVHKDEKLAKFCLSTNVSILSCMIGVHTCCINKWMAILFL